MKKAIVVLAVAGIAVLGGQAALAACTSDPSNKCTTRFADPNDWIARLVPGVGGQVLCDGIPASTVQYDSYKWSSGYVYVCTTNQTCSWAQSNDPQAYSKFCP